MANHLFFGDNLAVLRSGAIPPESIDLVYLDPPFNSNANYSLLFTEPGGKQSQAQIQAFEDTWHWGLESEAAFDDVLQGANQRLGVLLHSLRQALGDNPLMAYLAMMAVRLVELHRVLKPSGALYLHCDPSASHYLKVLLDAVFGPTNYLNEIIWRRTGSHNSAKRYGPIHDVIHFYRKSESYRHQPTFRPYMQGHVDGYFSKSDDRGRYWGNSIHGAGTRNGASGAVWRGYDPTAKGRHWAIPSELSASLGIDPDLPLLERLDAMAALGAVDLPDPSSGALPTYRQYLHTSPGVPLQDIWAYQPHTRGTLYGSEEGIDEDVRWLTKQGDKERLGYPTQKPLGLLRRIIESSCPPGGTVLDPFCGCGTTIHAAQRLERSWVGIDVTHLAISLIENRLEAAFPGLKYEIHGTPSDASGAQSLADRDKHQFEWWALSLVKAQPANDKKKGADKGIDGILWLRVGQKERAKVMVSVKGGANVSVAMIRDFGHVVQREKAAIGLFLTLHPPTEPMVAEAAKMRFYQWEGQRFPRLQILTIDALLNGAKPDLPLIDYAAMVKQAPLDKAPVQQGSLL